MGCTHTEGPYHDCAYVDARNAVHPQAEAFADNAAGWQPPIKGEAAWLEWAGRWNRAFHGFVDEATAK